MSSRLQPTHIARERQDRGLKSSCQRGLLLVLPSLLRQQK
jgi:hypothetical protein